MSAFFFTRHGRLPGRRWPDPVSKKKKKDPVEDAESRIGLSFSPPPSPEANQEPDGLKVSPRPLAECAEVSLVETPFKYNTTRSTIWSLFVLSSLLVAVLFSASSPVLQLPLLLLLLVIVFRPCHMIYLGDRIQGKLRLLYNRRFPKEGNNILEKVAKHMAVMYKKVKNAPKRKMNEGNLSRAGLLRPDLHGMDTYEIEALAFLEQSTSSLLGIYGMRGVGKSTLLWLVRICCTNHPSFDHVFYTVAESGFTVGTLRGVLARSIGLSSTSQVNLIANFLRDKTFLLLLDDLPYSFDLAGAGLPMPLGPQQKVIFTTRNQSICAAMGCVKDTIHMQSLGEDDAWNLFKYNLRNDIIDENPKIKYLAKKMVAECRGFPGALCFVGRTMSIKRNIKDWRVACDLLTMKLPSPNEIQDMDDEGYPCLQFFKDL